MLSIYPSLCEHQHGSQCLCCNFQVNALLPAAGRRCPGPGRVKSVSVGCCMIQTDSGPGVRHVVCRVMVCDVIMSTQYHAQCPPDHQPADYHQLLIVQCVDAGVSRILQYPSDVSGASASGPGYQLSITVPLSLFYGI